MFIQQGTVALGEIGATTLSISMFGTKSVIFDEPYKEPPIVLVYIDSSQPGQNGAVASTITQKGFLCGGWRFGNTVNQIANWVAIGEKA